jgi:hypothetical protein
MAMGTRQQRQRQEELWVATAALARPASFGAAGNVDQDSIADRVGAGIRKDDIGFFKHGEISSASRLRFRGKPTRALGVSRGGNLVQVGIGNWEALAAPFSLDNYGDSVHTMTISAPRNLEVVMRTNLRVIAVVEISSGQILATVLRQEWCTDSLSERLYS